MAFLEAGCLFVSDGQNGEYGVFGLHVTVTLGFGPRMCLVTCPTLTSYRFPPAAYMYVLSLVWLCLAMFAYLEAVSSMYLVTYLSKLR